MTAPRIELEPARYAMTGGGMSLYGLREGFEDAVHAGTLDAPDYLPTGAVACGIADPKRAFTSEVRPGVAC